MLFDLLILKPLMVLIIRGFNGEFQKSEEN